MSKAPTDRRAAIAQAAATAIARRGLAGASLREVAAETGQTLGVVTYYFSNRDELLAYTMATVVASIRHRSDELLAAGTDPVLATLLVALPIDRRSEVECRVWLAFADAAGRSPELSELFASYYREWEESVSAALTQVGVPDPARRARLLTATVDGIAVRAIASGIAADSQRKLLTSAVDQYRASAGGRVD